jgi:hypothetical protein
MHKYIVDYVLHRTYYSYKLVRVLTYILRSHHTTSYLLTIPRVKVVDM